MLDDTKWAGAHILAALSHVGLALTGVFFFIFGYKGFDAPFEKAAILPWATIAFGIAGALFNFGLYRSLATLNQVTALQSPRQLYHRRQVVMLGGFCILSFFCVGDLALAVNYSGAAKSYDVLSSYEFAAVMAAIAAALCVLTFIADLSKWYGQWRPDFLDSLQLEENQEGSAEEPLLGNGAQSQASPTVDLLQLGRDEP